MKFNWVLIRVEESNGFISKRILFKALFICEIIYGASFSISYKNFTRVLKPQDVMIKT